MRWIWGVTALAVAAAGTPASAKGPRRVVHQAVALAIEEWLGPDNYPPAAIRAGEQGRVVAIIAIDATGHPTACRIDISVGSPALEKGTCDVVLAKGKFAPARDANDRAVASELGLPVRWVLPEDGDDRQPSGPNHFTSITTIAADDSVSGCEFVADGRQQTAEVARCAGPGFDPAGLRARLKVVGGFRMRSDVLVRNGDVPPPLPDAPVTGRLLSLQEARQAVDEDGVPTNCTVVLSGEWAEEAKKQPAPTACTADRRFYPVRGKDGVPRPAQVLVAIWVTLLPPRN